MTKNSGANADQASHNGRRARLAALITAIAALALLALPASSLAATFTVNTTSDNAPTADECSGGAGDCSLRQAIDAANNDATDDTINVPSGNYHLTIPGTDETGDLTGDLDVNKATGALSIVGTDGARSTTVDASGLGDRALQLVQGSLTITGLTITGGVAPLNEGGGGIFNAGGALTVNDSTITGNTAASPNCGDGGGIESVTCLGPILLAQPAASKSAHATPHAMPAAARPRATPAAAAPVTSLSLSGDTISNNSAGEYGGGVEVNDGTAYIANTTITGNSGTQDSGGVDTNTSQAVEFINDTIDANTTPADAGGVWVGQSAMSFVNTIVAENTAGGSGRDCSGGTPTDNGHNVDTDGSCFTPSSTNGDKQGNPVLGPLQNNGGPTDTQALLDGSPAINAGDNSAAPSTDQRGIPRPQPAGGVSDIGAYEAVGPDAVTNKASKVKETSATLNGDVNPENLSTTYYFEYGKTNSYGSKTTATSAGSGNQAAAVAAAISHLKPSTTYHFRIVATNQVGTTFGSDRTFKTTGFKGAVAPDQTDHVNSAGNTTVKVNCPSSTSGDCAGTLTLSYHGTVLDPSFKIRSGRSHRVKVHLNSAGRKLLGRTGRLKVRATVKSHDPAGAHRTRVSAVTLVGPKRTTAPAFTG